MGIAMPTRILREGILTSERINALPILSELFFRRLMSVVDDYGRFHANPTILRSSCFPMRVDQFTDEQIKKCFEDCVSVGLIRLYNGGKCLEIVNFRQQRRSKSKFPAPDTEDAQRELLSNCKANDNQMIIKCEANANPTTPTSTIYVQGKEEGCGEKEGIRQETLDLKQKLNAQWKRAPDDPWTYLEETALVEIARRPRWREELEKIRTFLKRTPDDERKFIRGTRDLASMLDNWTGLVDRARNGKSHRFCYDS